MIHDEYSFASVEMSLESIGSHTASAWLIRASISLIHNATFGKLKSAFDAQANVFTYGSVRN